MKLEMSRKTQGHMIVESFYGELRNPCATLVETRMSDILGSDTPFIILDCQEVTEVDGYGLETLSYAIQRLFKRGKDVRLCLPAGDAALAVREELSAVISSERIHDDLTAALHMARTARSPSKRNA